MFYEEKLVLAVNEAGAPHVVCAAEPPVAPSGLRQHIGAHQGAPCMACTIDALPQSFTAVGLRAAYDLIGESLYLLAGKAWQMVYWDRRTRFCSFCGAATTITSAISKGCPTCGQELFPSIAPAVLALVRKGDAALLVRARNFNGPHYGLVAGFLEPGETFEECVRREIWEETALHVEGIRYVGNQPWPYPSGLMVGFTADYVAGEICLQDQELSEAAFFTADHLPQLPHKLSLARRMIDAWAATYGVTL